MKTPLGKLRGPQFGVQRSTLRKDDQRAGQKIYNTWRWRQLSAAVRKVHTTCMQCGAGGRLYVDHRTELADGGEPYALSNLCVLCGTCHARKGEHMRKARAGVG